jgi:hypothetical protein
MVDDPDPPPLESLPSASVISLFQLLAPMHSGPPPELIIFHLYKKKNNLNIIALGEEFSMSLKTQ